MALEAEIQAGAKAIALDCASVNCLRYAIDGDCAAKQDCECRNAAKLAIEAAEKIRASFSTNAA